MSSKKVERPCYQTSDTSKPRVPKALTFGTWPPPVYVATCDDGSAVRMSFWSDSRAPLDFERGRRGCAVALASRVARAEEALAFERSKPRKVRSSETLATLAIALEAVQGRQIVGGRVEVGESVFEHGAVGRIEAALPAELQPKAEPAAVEQAAPADAPNIIEWPQATEVAAVEPAAEVAPIVAIVKTKRATKADYKHLLEPAAEPAAEPAPAVEPAEAPKAKRGWPEGKLSRAAQTRALLAAIDAAAVRDGDTVAMPAALFGQLAKLFEVRA